jgi:hypothetical protein
MTIVTRFAGLFVRAMISCALVASLPAQASTGSLGGPGASNGRVLAQFDPALGETRVAGHVGPGLCYSLSLPQEWRLETEGRETRLEAAFSDASIALSLRSAEALQHLPQRDLASRDAALLQQDYEGLLGRPAQSVSLAFSVSGAVRWSATWVDANLPAPSRAMTVEAIIVPLSKEWVLELSPENVEAAEASHALLRQALTGLIVRSGADCRS